MSAHAIRLQPMTGYHLTLASELRMTTSRPYSLTTIWSPKNKPKPKPAQLREMVRK